MRLHRFLKEENVDLHFTPLEAAHDPWMSPSVEAELEALDDEVEEAFGGFGVRFDLFFEFAVLAVAFVEGGGRVTGARWCWRSTLRRTETTWPWSACG